MILQAYTSNNKAGYREALFGLRVLRVMRIFKITRHNQTLADFVQALRVISADLVVFLALMGTCLVMIATAIYMAEKTAHQALNVSDTPSALHMLTEHNITKLHFQNIPDSMYWALITMTSVGYGDIVPLTSTGKLIAVIAAFTGVLLMNMPIAFILLSFDEVYKVRRDREVKAEAICELVFNWVDLAKSRVFTRHKKLEATRMKKEKQKRGTKKNVDEKHVPFTSRAITKKRGTVHVLLLLMPWSQ